MIQGTATVSAESSISGGPQTGNCPDLSPASPSPQSTSFSCSASLTRPAGQTTGNGLLRSGQEIGYRSSYKHSAKMKLINLRDIFSKQCLEPGQEMGFRPRYKNLPHPPLPSLPPPKEKNYCSFWDLLRPVCPLKTEDASQRQSLK